ncbi:MAG: hypothetical protein KME06_02180 [Kastovskya adunca ATA6-11-RM4]|nr:hypothetical protein [Kastovskya adunca ATA6-11-RM4]
MSRLRQIIQNTFIRFVGFLQQIFNGFKNIFGYLGQLLGRFVRLLGFTTDGTFLEPEDAQGTTRAEPKQVSEPEETKPPVAVNPVRRSANSNMDYYRNLARQIKTSD